MPISIPNPGDLYWQLREQAEVCHARSAISRCVVDTTIVTRGFDAVVFGIDPPDSTRGTRWVSYDTAQQKIVTLMDDVNDACGQVPAVGKLGHRVTACVHVDVLGTGPAPGAGRFSGGHVLRAGTSIGKLPAGWRVVRFDPCWPPANVYMDPDPLDAIALTCDAEGEKFQLYHVMSDAIRAMSVTGGPELARFFAWHEHVIYPGPKGQVFRMRISPFGRAEPVTDPGLIARVAQDFVAICRGTSGQFGGFRPLPRRQFMFAGDGSLHAFLFPDDGRNSVSADGLLVPQLADVTQYAVDQWTRSDLIRWFLEKGRQPAESPGRVDGEPVAEAPAPVPVPDSSMIIFARQGFWPDVPATLHLLLPGEYDEPIELGPLAPHNDRVMFAAHALRVMPSGEVAVIAGCRESTVIQIYANPILERFTRRINEHVDRVVARTNWPTAQGETITSLYEFGSHHDRGYSCAVAASDGAIHFGSTPHHPRHGASLFRYEPADTQRGVELLGDFDRLAGNLAQGDIPSMLHTCPIELKGRLIWIGQDPFYGVHDFPGMTPLTHRYRGSPVLSYDLRTRRFDLMGVPLPGRESIFEVHADFTGQELFFREGYHASRWYRQRIDQRFRFDGPPEPMALVDAINVNRGSDGRLFYVTPERNHWPEEDVPPVTLRVYDPAKNESRDVVPLVAAAVRVGGDDRWSIVHDSTPDDRVLLINDAGALICVDLATRKHRPIAPCLEAQGIEGVGAVASQLTMHDVVNERVIAFRSITRPFVLVSICVTDLRTGKTEHLGVLRDQHGRPMQSVTFALLHEGVVYYSGFSWGHPGDPHYIRRQAFSYVARVDTVFGAWRVPGE